MILSAWTDRLNSGICTMIENISKS